MVHEGVYSNPGRGHKLVFSLSHALGQLLDPEDHPPTLADKLDSDPAALDHTVRRKFSHLLDSSYRPFPFADLPVELALPILSYATGCSQGTYRSLLLTNKGICDLIRAEKMLCGVSVILSTPWQLEAFEWYLQTRPEAIPQIHALWTICPFSSERETRASIPVSTSIIQMCTNIHSLACHSRVLPSLVDISPFQHTRCVDLTTDSAMSWYAIMDAHSCTHGAEFFHQIQRLHFLGAVSPYSDMPALNNLTRMSVAMGSARNVVSESRSFRSVLKSPKLQQVVITTRLTGDEQEFLAEDVHSIDPRFSVLYRRRRWREPNLWHESFQDPDRFWNQATAEKHVLDPARKRPVRERNQQWGHPASDTESDELADWSNPDQDWAADPNDDWATWVPTPEDNTTGVDLTNELDTESLQEEEELTPESEGLGWTPDGPDWTPESAQAGFSWRPESGKTWRTPES
ncbi:hypothetical protein C8F04DRAFT_1250492 [Mycena alexandri]|uniref:Uncharacterized protein n=1 Tax=Mycena alexandri TaxID=1745969 RepID=A0AAD6XDD2_9AGAR|nr:hypothetical protein C8F04DRAFT_1250492 [Mycena alexandri]